jgi:hypothetical protein
MSQPPDPSMPRDQQPPLESDEDLFNFDELVLDSRKATEEMRKELDEALSQVDHLAQDVLAAIETAPPQAPAVAPPPAVVQHRIEPTPLLSALLAALVVFHLGAAFVSWRSLRSVEDVILDLGHEVVDSTTSLRTSLESEVSAGDAGAPALFGALPEGYRTLELAQQRIERGEHARARRTLNGLLAIVDRIDDPARKDVEARAAFLIAESYRVEALAAHAREPRPAPEEQR